MKRFYILSFIIIFLFLSCLTVNKKVKYLKPADINVSADIKTIAVLASGSKYKEEMYGLLLNVFGREEVKERYELIDRENLDLILKEQNLYNRDEFDDSTAVKLGKLAGAQAIVIGSYKSVIEKKESGVMVVKRKYLEGYEYINNVKIPKYRYVDENVSSTIYSVFFTIDIRMLDIKNGTLIHNESESYKGIYETWIDDKPENTLSVVKNNGKIVSTFPTINEILIATGKEFADNFAKKVAPYYVQEKMSFEVISGDSINAKFIQFIKAELYDEAMGIMIDSMPAIESITKLEVKSKHYYNLGCVYEIKGDLETAKTYYEKAVKYDPTKLHLAALKSIKDRIVSQEKLKKQIEKKDSNSSSSNNDW
ncbi:MAG TPA: CsgG/HfaB family protein [Spirochaetota bacterium]|nr:CsgG/HfaB family protein [Spirochaetota bacterium]HOL56218.1 CsgG/HfaB family protein [Spirochaetota bacterium]HPP03809.1 CsgG/HfaB family protein [Spirochaetota bacterium]